MRTILAVTAVLLRRPRGGSLLCGSGGDVVHADMRDLRRGRIAADCEILRGVALVVPDGEATQPAADKPAGCKYVTKPVLVPRGGQYVFEQQCAPPTRPGACRSARLAASRGKRPATW